MLPLLAAALAVACPATPPHGPVVPAPIVLRTRCGAFRLAPDGEVARLPPRWLARDSGGTGRAFGADLAVRRTRPGRFVLLRSGRVLWRSHELYPNDGGSVAFGPHAFAFASYRRGVFLTDLVGRERRVAAGTGLYPVGFVRGGRLLVRRPRAIDVVGHEGRLVRRLEYRPRNGFVLDERAGVLFFVARDGRLTSTDGVRAKRLRRLDADGDLFAADRFLILQGPRSFVVARRDGSIVARTRWRRLESDSGVAVSPDGSAFAFRLRDRRANVATVLVLRAGATRARVIARRPIGPPACVVSAGLGWNGRFLLYASTTGDLAVLDSRGGRARDLVPLVRALGGSASAWWERDLA